MVNIYLTDCPESALGGLSGADALPDIKRINGVDVPLFVLRQLHQHGYPPEKLTRGELLEAVHACAFDGNLIDDPHGHSFLDKLSLTPAEARARSHENRCFVDDLACAHEHGETHLPV